MGLRHVFRALLSSGQWQICRSFIWPPNVLVQTSGTNYVHLSLQPSWELFLISIKQQKQCRTQRTSARHYGDYGSSLGTDATPQVPADHKPSGKATSPLARVSSFVWCLTRGGSGGRGFGAEVAEALGVRVAE